jgi:hypothetical protein
MQKKITSSLQCEARRTVCVFEKRKIILSLEELQKSSEENDQKKDDQKRGKCMVLN